MRCAVAVYPVCVCGPTTGPGHQAGLHRGLGFAMQGHGTRTRAEGLSLMIVPPRVLKRIAPPVVSVERFVVNASTLGALANILCPKRGPGTARRFLYHDVSPNLGMGTGNLSLHSTLSQVWPCRPGLDPNLVAQVGLYQRFPLPSPTPAPPARNQSRITPTPLRDQHFDSLPLIQDWPNPAPFR